MNPFEARRRREWMLIGLVMMTALMANLPRDITRALNLDTTYLVGLLGMLVLLALFLYVRFTFFLLYALLIVGANLPTQWAEGLGISKMPMLIALGFMVAASLVNHVTRLVPSGLEPKPKSRSVEGSKALNNAIVRNNINLAQRILAMDIDPNQVDDEGLLPLQKAIESGNLELVNLLLKATANPALPCSNGVSLLHFAEGMGHAAIADSLRAALAAAQDQGEARLGPESGFAKTF
jgi:hypothetical protein